MISIDSVKKLNTSIIYLARARDEPSDPFGQGLLLGADPIGLNPIIDAPEPRQSADGLVLSSMRSQLIVTIGPNRIQFGDASGEEPAREDFPDRVTQAAEYIRSLSGQVYTAVGLNFDVEWEPDHEDLPSKAMLDRFVKEGTLKDTGYDAIGASARLWYVARDRIYDLRIEPMGNQYDGRNYFAHLNVHIGLEGETPSAEWLSRALKEEYGDFMRVLTEVLEPKERR